MARPGGGLLSRSILCAAIGLGFAVPVYATKTPAQLTASFADRPARTMPKDSPSCRVNFTQVEDQRRSPELAGVIGKRAILAPTDSKAWLRAVLSGLNVRGVATGFDSDAPTGAISATFSLQTAWLQDSVETYNGNVVVHLNARTVAGATLDQTYRGRVSRTAYWSGGSDTMQSAMDGAFANALDAMATDLKQLCTS